MRRARRSSCASCAMVMGSSWSTMTPIESVCDFRALVVEAVRLLDEGIVGRLKRFTAVHAGVVEFAGRALLLPGGTHTGKSSLVAELLRRGAVYFSDEYALIDAQGRAHAYPRPLLLRNGGPDQVPYCRGNGTLRVGGGPVPVGWISRPEIRGRGHLADRRRPAERGLFDALEQHPSRLSREPPDPRSAPARLRRRGVFRGAARRRRRGRRRDPPAGRGVMRCAAPRTNYFRPVLGKAKKGRRALEACVAAANVESGEWMPPRAACFPFCTGDGARSPATV